ncbi:unnamed protein product [Camellia sinensis]
MILPVVKLGTLALKTACKPIANRLKKEAGLHPKFRQLIVNIAQANHRFMTNMQRRIYGHATDVAIRPLNEEKAVQAAADLLGELFVFTLDYDCGRNVAGAAVIFEVQRSSRSEARKEELGKEEMQLMDIFKIGISLTEHPRDSCILPPEEMILKEDKKSRRAMKQRDEDLAREVEILKQKIAEVEQLAKGQGLGGMFNFRHAHSAGDGHSKPI